MGNSALSLAKNSAFLRTLPIHNEADRDDAIQTALLKLLAEPMVTPQLFYTTIVNSHRDSLKAERRRRNREHRFAEAEYHRRGGCGQRRGCTGQLLHAPDEVIADPSARLRRRDERAAILRAIRAAGLSREHQCALRPWAHNSLIEFARRRGVPEATARCWAKRARDPLRPHLEREGIGPE